MKAKTILFAIMSHLIFGAICVFVVDQFRGTSVSLEQLQIIEVQKDKLKKAIKTSEEVINRKQKLLSFNAVTIDSLQGVIVRIIQQSSEQVIQIDQLIADDSSRAVEQYRIALQNLGVVPDMSERLTFREIGHGAKFMFQFQGLQLQVSVDAQRTVALTETMLLHQQVIAEQNKIIIANDELLMWSSEEVELYKSAYEESSRWMANRIVLSLTFGGSYGFDQIVRPSIQLGLGVRIWGNK